MRGDRELHHRVREIAMTERDLDDYTELLLRKFPGLKLLPRDYWEELAEGPAPPQRKKPANLKIDYLNTLSDPRTKLKIFWIEPPDWEPFWLGPNENGIYFIANQPHLWAWVDCAGLYPGGNPWDFRGGRILGTYAPGDREHKAFVDAAIRLSEKITSNLAKVIDRHTHETLHEARKTRVWIGRDAFRWAREDTRRTIDQDLRPVEESF